MAPVSWKLGTLRTPWQRTYLVCSTEIYSKEELSHLESNYPKYVIKKVFPQVKEEYENRNYSNNMKNSIDVPITLENKNEKQHVLTVSCQGEKRDYLFKLMKRNLKILETSKDIYRKETWVIISNKRSNCV